MTFDFWTESADFMGSKMSSPCSLELLAAAAHILGTGGPQATERVSCGRVGTGACGLAFSSNSILAAAVFLPTRAWAEL